MFGFKYSSFMCQNSKREREREKEREREIGQHEEDLGDVAKKLLN